MNVGWKVSFSAMWIGQAFSLVGSSLVGFALVWWLADQTGSAVVLTLATIANTMPTVLLGPVVGTLVDRWSRRRGMIVADGLMASFTALLAFLFGQGQVQVWYCLAILFVRSLGDAFQNLTERLGCSRGRLEIFDKEQLVFEHYWGTEATEDIAAWPQTISWSSDEERFEALLMFDVSGLPPGEAGRASFSAGTVLEQAGQILPELLSISD